MAGRGVSFINRGRAICLGVLCLQRGPLLAFDETDQLELLFVIASQLEDSDTHPIGLRDGRKHVSIC